VRVERPVSVRDIPATVMALAAGADTTFPGTSLARYWSGGAPPEESVLADLAKESEEERAQPASRRRVLSLVRGRWHYLRVGADGERLFDYVADPAEERDLAADPAHRGTLEALRAATDSLRPRG
jgi:choline-sulfatase